MFVQKHLLGRAQWMGLVVHKAAEWFVKALAEGRRVDPRGIVGRAMGEARRAVDHSATELYRGDPKAFTGFAAHYYEQPFDATEAMAELEDMLGSLFEHAVLQRIEEVPERIREVEALRKVKLAGVDLWLSPDVVMTDGVGGFVVVDWKTGKMHHPDDVDGQLGLYGLYVLKNYLGVDPDSARDLPLHRVKGLYAHVSEGAHRTVSLRVSDVDAALHAISTSAPKMAAVNRAAEGEMPPQSAFPLISEGDPKCSWCSFRRTCERG